MKTMPSGLLAALLAAALLGACASYGPAAYKPGASADEVIQGMGRPSGEHALPGGGRRLEFARGPLGRHTYMLDFDAAGRLVQSQQVLTENNFNAIRAGMTATEVLASIGRPSTIWHLARQRQNVWSYRYESWPFCKWFMVGMGYDDKVIDTAYGPDPLCEEERRDLLVGARGR